MKLKDKVAIITGAARGIGRATAVELARNGADVVINDLAHEREAAEVVKQIEGFGHRARFFQGDVADRDCDQQMIEETVREFGRVDIFVNNAARGIRKPFLELTVEDVERTWAVSQWGCSTAANSRPGRW